MIIAILQTLFGGFGIWVVLCCVWSLIFKSFPPVWVSVCLAVVAAILEGGMLKYLSEDDEDDFYD